MTLTETINKIAKGVGPAGFLIGSIMSFSIIANKESYKSNIDNNFYSKLRQPQKTLYDYALTTAMASGLMYYIGKQKLIKKF